LHRLGCRGRLVPQLNKLSAAERRQTLIDGAKKEGELMLYSSFGLEEIQALVKAFGKKYPFLQTRYKERRQPAVYRSADGICRQKILGGHLLGGILDHRPNAQGKRHVGALHFPGNSGGWRLCSTMVGGKIVYQAENF
jgi:hypothetical protein